MRISVYPVTLSEIALKFDMKVFHYLHFIIPIFK
jgi:hypothetical protein